VHYISLNRELNVSKILRGKDTDELVKILIKIIYFLKRSRT
jgi:hypothetical protein